MKKRLLLLLAGIGIGILLAPDKGSATRRKIIDSFDDLKESLADQAGDLYDQGKEMAHEASHEMKGNMNDKYNG